MLDALLLILILIQLALLYRAAKESSVRRIEMRYKLRRREKLEEGIRRETEDAANSIEKLTIQLAEIEGKVKDAATEMDRLEQRKQTLKARPPVRLYVFDRTTLSSDNLWEILIRNPDFTELVSAKRAPPELVNEWQVGRVFLVGSSTGEDAATRCAARFPSSLGYRVENIAPYRGLNRR